MDKGREIDKKIFRQDAKIIVDSFYDGKLFNRKLTRDDMNIVEEMIGDLIFSRYNAHLRGQALLKKITILNEK